MITTAEMRAIQESLNRIEDKLDDRVSALEVRTNTLESKLSNMIGKAAIGFVIFMSVFGVAVTAAVDWIRRGGR